MIGFPVEFDEFAAPSRASEHDDLTQPRQNGRCDATPPILRNHNQVVMQGVNAMAGLIHLDFFAHVTKIRPMSEPVNRRTTYKLYPSASQAEAMERLCDLHRQLYNAALEERIDAFRKAGKSISFAEQCKSLTLIRQQNPEYLAVNAQSAQVTLKRLDKAFAARRLPSGLGDDYL